MDSLIQTTLENLSKKHQVKIIYACESGSRTWGFSSIDSDYDVRFIYMRPIEWYLSINVENKTDVIEYTDSDKALDIVGWDLRKACKLLYKSNPPLIEWLTSPIVYIKEPIIDSLIEITQLCYNRQNAYYHYYSMAKNNFDRHLTTDGSLLESETKVQESENKVPENSETMVRAKKYFCVLRPIFAIEWISHSDLIVPNEFETLLAHSTMPDKVRQEITTLLTKKRANQGVFTVPFNQVINDFILEKLDKTKPEFVKQSVDIEIVNQTFQEIINTCAVIPEIERTPLEAYVKNTLAPRLSKNEECRYIMPDPAEDFERFMRLHSWYKHFRGRVVNVYPMLRISREPRNDIHRDPNDDDDVLHWWFTTEDTYEDPMDDLYESTSPLINMAPKHYFHVNQLFGNYSQNDMKLREFNIKSMEKTCQKVWELILEKTN